MRAPVPGANPRRTLAGLAAWVGLAAAAAATAGCSDPSEELASSDPAVAVEALRACRTSAGDDVADKVARAVARPEPAVAAEAVRSLGRMRNPRAVRTLIRIASSAAEPRATVRREAVVQLGRRRDDPDAVAALRQAVQADADPRVRAAAATGLGWRRSPADVPLLLEVAETDADPMVQACAVSAVERWVGLRFRYDPHASPDARRRVLEQVREMAMRTTGGPSKGHPEERGADEAIEP